jgi:hypothetical protein
MFTHQVVARMGEWPRSVKMLDALDALMPRAESSVDWGEDINLLGRAFRILVQLCKYSLSLQAPLIAFYLSRSILILFRAFPAFQIPLNHHDDGRRNRRYYPSQAGEARPGAFSPSIAFLTSFSASSFPYILLPSSTLHQPQGSYLAADANLRQAIELLKGMAEKTHANEPGALRYAIHQELNPAEGQEGVDIVMVELYGFPLSHFSSAKRTRS